jgi:hypothetical protein
MVGGGFHQRWQPSLEGEAKDMESLPLCSGSLEPEGRLFVELGSTENEKR